MEPDVFETAGRNRRGQRVFGIAGQALQTARGLSGLTPEAKNTSQLSPTDKEVHSSGGRKEHTNGSETDTEQAVLLPLGHTRKLLQSQATEALCAQSPPVPSLTSPQRKRQSSCATEVAMPPTKLGKCSMNVPGVPVWNLDAHI